MTEDDIRDGLRHVIDPEVGVNIVDLGLVYGVEIDGGKVKVVMTMTSPACPLGDYLKDEVETALRMRVPEVQQVEIEIAWYPPWDPSMMSLVAKRHLNWPDDSGPAGGGA